MSRDCKRNQQDPDHRRNHHNDDNADRVSLIAAPDPLA
jgi:hypothetical protein